MTFMTPEKIATSEPPPLWIPNVYKAATPPGNPRKKPMIGLSDATSTLDRDTAVPTDIAMSTRLDNAPIAQTHIIAVRNVTRTPHPSSHWCRSCSLSPHPALVALK